MSHLPVIVGFGGINCAGRSSFHHGYRRLVYDSLSDGERSESYTGLATLMGLLNYSDNKYVDSAGTEIETGAIPEKLQSHINDNTLLRQISDELFEVNRVSYNKKAQIRSWNSLPTVFQLTKKDLPEQIPQNWSVAEDDEDPDSVNVFLPDSMGVYLPDYRRIKAQTGGQLPTGFDPASQYSSKHHPRGLQMAVYAATDAIRSTGLDWTDIQNSVEPNQIGVYASSAMGQLDTTGTGGMMKAGALGQRASSKQLAMGLVQMPSDFINAYVLGNLGHTSAQVGACATLLYNLNAAVRDIQSGKRKVAIVGSSEAPLIPEIIEGYRAMSALGDDAQILKLDRNNNREIPDYRRACRPFSENCGFALGESAQYFVLFADDLAVELGAQMFGAVAEVYIHADGYKKSISSPGFGNNVSLARAAGFIRSVFGEESLRNQSFVSAHGTGTPQNRTTESFGLNEVAKAFNIDNWPISAIKCYVGHSLGPASGNQLAAVLGTWQYGLIPGIATLDQVAEDVHQSHLYFSQDHIEIERKCHCAALINSKGFGGNNGTGVIISPEITRRMLECKHGKKKMLRHHEALSAVTEKADRYDQDAIKGLTRPIYRFGAKTLEESDLHITKDFVEVPGFKKRIRLDTPSPYPDMGFH